MAVEVPNVRILIVDDDKAICDYMETLLEKDGFNVKAVSDPTPDRLSRLQAATARHVAAARMLGLCAARLMRATAR